MTIKGSWQFADLKRYVLGRGLAQKIVVEPSGP